MPYPFSALPAGLRPFAALLALGGLAGCLFDTVETAVPPRKYSSVVLDTLYPSTVPAARTVALFQPLRDPSLAGQPPARPETFAPVHVKDGATGEIVRYVLTRQRFGTWTPGLEFQWNYFLLQVNFLFPLGLPDTAGLEGRTGSLYTEVHKTDRFTNYFDSAAAPGAMDRITTTTKPGGIGIEVGLGESGDSLLVRRVVAGAPAGRAGIARGMVVLAIDDSSVTGDSALDRFARFAAGDSGEPIVLRMLDGGTERDFRMVREPVDFPTVYADSLDGIGYIAVTGFMPATVDGLNTATEFRKALDATRRFAITLLDLRDNGGGSLDLALRMCDEILPAGAVIIRQQQRQFSEEDHVPLQSAVTHLATGGGAAEKRSFVLLADGGSASASEIFLAAVRDGTGSPLVGQKTYGKGVGQVVRSTPGNGLALVTFLKFTGAKGLDYHGHGLEPDYPDTLTGDRLLAKAAEVARGGGSPAARKAAAGAKGSGKLADLAKVAEWNRRQALRPGIRDLDLDGVTPPVP
jgi:C-terminal peptidase prc